VHYRPWSNDASRCKEKDSVISEVPGIDRVRTFDRVEIRNDVSASSREGEGILLFDGSKYSRCMHDSEIREVRR